MTVTNDSGTACVFKWEAVGDQLETVGDKDMTVEQHGFMWETNGREIADKDK